MSTTTPDPLMRLAESLETRGWVVIDHFLEADEARQLAAESLADWDADAFRSARVGLGAERVIREDIRRDRVLWLEDETTGPAAKRYLEGLERVRQAINRRCFMGLFDYEGHFAVYEPGAFYKAHLDRHRGTTERAVTAILYLNEGWVPEDGGRLKLWTDPGKQDGPCEWVEPRLGTLVVFLAGEYWHEVEVARRQRMSVTGWFLVRS